jgi:hypothetical protein
MVSPDVITETMATIVVASIGDSLLL